MFNTYYAIHVYALNTTGLKAGSVYALNKGYELNKGYALNNGVRLTTRVYGRAAEEDAYDNMNKEVHVIASKLDTANRMDATSRKEAFVTLKDDKNNFKNSLPCGLINPAKSEMRRVSKRVLDNINGRLKGKLNPMPWKKSAAVIGFIELKETWTFIKKYGSTMVYRQTAALPER